jgi:hypothetical protein
MVGVFASHLPTVLTFALFSFECQRRKVKVSTARALNLYLPSSVLGMKSATNVRIVFRRAQMFQLPN